MKLALISAADGAGWESRVVQEFGARAIAAGVLRRCVDVVELMAVASSGIADAALIDAGLRRLDPDAVDRLYAAGVAPVGVVTRGDEDAAQRLRAIGIAHLVWTDSDVEVFATVAQQAARELREDPDPARARAFAVTSATTVPGDDVEAPGWSPGLLADGEAGSVIAVWGPTGAPGRTVLALNLADELGRAGPGALVIDADPYGGVLDCMLALLEEQAGLAAACRRASSAGFDPRVLAEMCWQVAPELRALTGIRRADRWPELRIASVPVVLDAARELVPYTVIDTGFCLEVDEELMFDAMAPRRNGVTLAALDACDLIVVVGSADPVGLQRLVRGLDELTEREIAAPRCVVLNRVRGAGSDREQDVSRRARSELAEALERFAAVRPAAFIPFDPETADLAASAGSTWAETRPGSAIRQSVQALAQQVAADLSLTRAQAVQS